MKIYLQIKSTKYLVVIALKHLRQLLVIGNAYVRGHYKHGLKILQTLQGSRTQKIQEPNWATTGPPATNVLDSINQ